MVTKNEIESRIAKLEAEQAVAKMLVEISRNVNSAESSAEVLEASVRPGQKAGAYLAQLLYIDLDDSGVPEWAEVVAVWQREETPALPGVLNRFYLPEFPATELWFRSYDEPQTISDLDTYQTTDENKLGMLSPQGCRTTAVIPLSRGGRWLGIMTLHWTELHKLSEQELTIYRALSHIVSLAVENHRLVNNLDQMAAEQTAEVIQFKSLADNSLDGIVIGNLQGQIVYANWSFYDMFGYDYQAEDLIAIPIHSLWPDVTIGFLTEEMLPQGLTGGWRGELRQLRKNGSSFDADVTMSAILDDNGQPTGSAVIIRDIAEQKQAEIERESLQQEVIKAQRRALQELSTPIIPIVDRIIVMPLIGSIDTLRAKEITRVLLRGISEYRARIVILDLTGVPLVDSGVASHLNKTIQAARLKGAHTIVTGIADAVAETVVELGLDWSNIETLDNLQTGLLTALNRLGVSLTRNDNT